MRGVLVNSINIDIVEDIKKIKNELGTNVDLLVEKMIKEKWLSHLLSYL